MLSKSRQLPAHRYDSSPEAASRRGVHAAVPARAGGKLGPDATDCAWAGADFDHTASQVQLHKLHKEVWFALPARAHAGDWAICTQHGWGNGRKRPFGCRVHRSRHVCTPLCMTEESYTHCKADFPSWKPPPLILCFGYIKLGILKACWLGFFYFYFLFYSLNWALFWICFKMNAAFIPITGSSPAFLSIAAFSLHLALTRQLSLSQVGWRHFYSSSTRLRISGSWFLNYLNVNSIHLIVQIGMSLANPHAFQLTSVSCFFALVINVRIYFWSQLLKGGQNYSYFYSRVLSGFKPCQPTISYTRTTQQCC